MSEPTSGAYGVLCPVHQTKADHTPSDGQESGGGKATPRDQAIYDSIAERHFRDRIPAASVGQAAPDGVGGKDGE